MPSISDRILEGTTDAFIALDGLGHVTFANDPAVRLFARAFGVALERLEGRALWEGSPALAEGSLREGCERAARDGAPVEFEEPFPPSGAWLAVHIFPSENGLSLFCRDITELRQARENHRLLAREREARADAEVARRQAEAEREERERAVALLDAVLASTPAGHAFVDRELRYLQINPLLAAVNGLPVEAHLGRTVREVLPEAADQLEALARRVLETGENISFDVTTASPLLHHGEPREYLATYYPVRDRKGTVLGIGAHLVDRTEQMRAFHSLRDSEVKFRSVAQATAAILWTASPAGSFETEQPDWGAFTGRSPAEYIGPGGWDSIHPEDRQRAQAEWQEALRTRSAYQTEYRVLRHDGEYRHMLVRAVPILNEAGAIREWVGAHTDVTEQRRAEQEARSNEERYRSLVQATAAIVWTTPASGIFNADQPGWTAFTGQTLAEYMDGGGLDAVHPEDRQRSMERWMEAVQNRAPFQGEQRLRRRDGEYRHMSIRAVPILDGAGEIREWVGLHVDVTDQKQAEAALRESEERYRTLIRATAAVVWNTPASGEFETEQPEWTAFTGQTTEELRGWGWLKAIHPDDRGVTARAWDRSLRTSSIYQVEHRLRRHTGEHRHMLVRAVPILEGDRIREWVGIHTDITEQKRAGEALRRSEERLRAAVSASGAGVFRWEFSTDALEWDENLDRLFGLEPGRSARSLEQFLEMVHPEDRDAVISACGRCREEGAEFDLEFRAVLPNGEIRWLDDKGKTIFDAAGRPLYMTGACTDITERKAAEAALRESEQRFRTVADAMPQMVWVTRPDGWHEYYNQRWYEYTGLTPEESIGWGWSGPLHPDDKARSERRWAAATSTGDPYEIEYRFRGADGEYRWFLGRALPLRDERGGITRWFGTCTDIHEQKLAEADRQRSLAREQERSRQLRELARAALEVNAALTLEEMLPVITRRAREILGAHQAVTSMSAGSGCEQGVRATSLSESYSRWSAYVPEPYDAGIFELICHRKRPVRLTQADLELHPGWLGRTREPGQPPMHGWLAAPLVSRDGRNLGLIQLSDKYDGDFTEDDETLLVQMAQMAAVAIEKMQLYEAIRQADQAKTEFLAMLAHELRNPLAPVANAVQLLRSDLSSARQGAARDVIQRQVRHMSRLVDDLLDVSRITRGKIELRKERLALADVVEQAVEAARPLIVSERHTLQVRLPDETVWLDADAARLTQVLTNLLNNAAKYTRAGGEISLQAVVVPGGDPATSPSAVEISVRDNGVGIHAADLERIFDLFSQVERDLARSQGGLGIGLTLVQNLVQMHGGSVHASSDGPGAGAEFVVRLPVAGLEAGVSSSPPPAAHASLTVTNDPDPGAVDLAPTVLVIDDNTDAAETTAELLLLWDFEALTAHDGFEGIMLARERRPDVVLLDIGLPGMDGYAVAAELRRMPETARIRLIAVTGYGGAEDLERAAAAGFDHHLTKPVDPEALRKILDATRRR